MSALRYWCKIYETLKYDSLCLDIETTEFDGPIAVIGVFRPKEGEIECTHLIKGRNLTQENLKEMLKDIRMIITYNGLSFDIPKIRKEFPESIPENVFIFDLYLFAKKLGINASLKNLEETYNIRRLKDSTAQRGIALTLWKKYQYSNDIEALNELIEYNKQDTVNLYPLAEVLTARAREIIH